MNVTFEENIRTEALRRVAEQMLIAARTAPKAKGVDNLSIALVGKEGIKQISDKLKEMAASDTTLAFLLRDAENILSAEQLVLIGTRYKSVGVRWCNLCGKPNCEEKDKHPDVPCVFNTGDLGIAIGSAVSKAADERVDTRVMFSIGRAVLAMNMLGEGVKLAFGIPLSSSGKNPFFDRK
jgi:uncharacterized ferredoxin-like protein